MVLVCLLSLSMLVIFADRVRNVNLGYRFRKLEIRKSTWRLTQFRDMIFSGSSWKPPLPVDDVDADADWLRRMVGTSLCQKQIRGGRMGDPQMDCF